MEQINSDLLSAGNIGGNTGGITDSNRDVENSGSAPSSAPKGENTPDSIPAAKYTDEDIGKLKTDFEKRLQEETARAAEEALKKAKMKPDEAAEYERTQKLAELERREKEACLRELKLDTLGLLAEKQLSKDFLEYIIGLDKESTVKRIEAFKPLFDAAVQAQVEVRLAGKTPAAGNGASEQNSAREQFRNALGGN